MDILKISATDEMQIQSERNVSLVCSSGLSDEFSSLDIPVTFLFHSKHDNDEHNVSATCNSDNTVSVNNGKWIITRQQSPPHDCVLTIVDFGEHNVGKYRCAGVLSQSSSLILQVDDWSNNLHLKLLTNLKPVRDFSLSQLGVWATIFFGVIVTSIAAIFLAFLVIASYSAYKRHRRRRRGLIYDQGKIMYTIMIVSEFTTVHMASVPPRSYGSHLSLRQNNDLSRPSKLLLCPA